MSENTTLDSVIKTYQFGPSAAYQITFASKGKVVGLVVVLALTVLPAVVGLALLLPRAGEVPALVFVSLIVLALLALGTAAFVLTAAAPPRLHTRVARALHRLKTWLSLPLAALSIAMTLLASALVVVLLVDDGQAIVDDGLTESGVLAVYYLVLGCVLAVMAFLVAPPIITLPFDRAAGRAILTVHFASYAALIAVALALLVALTDAGPGDASGQEMLLTVTGLVFGVCTVGWVLVARPQREINVLTRRTAQILGQLYVELTHEPVRRTRVTRVVLKAEELWAESTTRGPLHPARTKADSGLMFALRLISWRAGTTEPPRELAAHDGLAEEVEKIDRLEFTRQSAAFCWDLREHLLGHPLTVSPPPAWLTWVRTVLSTR